MSGDNTSINNGSYPFTHNTAFVTHPSHPLPPAQYPVGSVMFPATYGYTFMSQAPMFPHVIPYPYNGSNGTPGGLFSSTYIPQPQRLTYSRNGIYPLQATVLPHAFPIMTFQDLTRNMDTGASSHLADNTGFYTTSMADEPQHHNMDGKPLFDILTKLPSKSLLRFRCVSKLWRELVADSYFVSVHDKQVIKDTTLIMFKSGVTGNVDDLCFHTIECDTITNHVLKSNNKVPVFEFEVNESPYKTSYATFVGSCNGLVLIKNGGIDKLMPTYIVIHPIIKQYYVLPKLPYKCGYRASCGLGFDSSTNTFKMVCVYPYHFAMVHVFGTNSWRKIPQVPTFFLSRTNAIFAHGCLHWMVHEEDHGAREVIWFDVKSEEFGLMKPPKTESKPTKRKYNDPVLDHLVNLDGQVGYFVNKKTEVWILNHKKEWMLHCGFEDNEFPHDSLINVLGCLNKDRYILIKVSFRHITKELFYIYNLENRVIHKARIDGLDLEYRCKIDIVTYPDSLLDIIRNSNLFKKRA